MEKSGKKIEISWISIALILAFAGGALYFGVRSSRLSKAQEEHISQQASLQTKLKLKDSVISVINQRVEVLEADAKRANRNTEVATVNMEMFKRKYLELKNQVPPSPCDSFPVLVSCENQIRYHQNYEEILKANILAQARRGDTLQIANNHLEDAYGICKQLTLDQNQELTDTRKKLRRTKIFSWGLGGALLGALTVLFVN